MALWTSVEQLGCEPVPVSRRHGKARDLGWVWFAANIGVLSLVFGAVLGALGLDLMQALVAVAVGSALSFLLVGVVAVAGKWGGMPTLVLSRAAFGRRGNLGPAALGWVNVVGWEVVTSVVAAWALAMLAVLVLPTSPGQIVDASCLAIVVLASLTLGVLGHEAIVRFQRAASLTFGALTLLVAAFLVSRTNWHEVATAHAASLAGVVAATSIVAAGTGLSWVNVAADYSRYLPGTEKGRHVVLWVALASTLPTMFIVIVGYLLASDLGGIATSGDPIRLVGGVLPPWMAAPYLLAAVGGMLAQTDLACYSSGLGLMALGVRLRRSRTIFIDAGVVLGLGLVVMLGRQGFIGPFESFLEVLGDGLAAWAGVFLVDMWMARQSARRRQLGVSLRRRDIADIGGESLAYHYLFTPDLKLAALVAWCSGTALALATTVCPWFTGPLAIGMLREGSFGFVVGFVTAVLVLLVLSLTIGSAGAVSDANEHR